MHDLATFRELVPVSIETLRPNSVVEFDLFLGGAAAQKPVLFRERRFPIEADDLAGLAESGVQTLYIAPEETAAYERYLREQVIFDRSIPAPNRYKLLRDVCRASFLEALRSNCPAKMVESAVRMAAELVEVICDDDLLLADLFAVMQHDYCTFTHVTNVCAYSVALAQALGVNDRAELTKIAVGALLHDIGKRHVPSAILQKPGKLTSREFEVVKKHPRDGFEELAGRADLEWGQLMMVYQHHERPDGGGYPVGVEEDELHPWAALCAVVDVFEALTSERPYRTAAPVGQALGYLYAKAGKQFNEGIVQCWIRTVTRKR